MEGGKLLGSGRTPVGVRRRWMNRGMQIRPSIFALSQKSWQKYFNNITHKVQSPGPRNR